MQQTTLKALARNALACNTPCNAPATNPEKPCNKQAPKTPPNVARNVAPAAHLPNTRERLLAVARELGLPDALLHRAREAVEAGNEGALNVAVHALVDHAHQRDLAINGPRPSVIDAAAPIPGAGTA